MKDKIKSKWDEILNLLETEHGVSHIIIDTWIKPLQIYDVKDHTIIFLMDEKLGHRGIQFLENKMYDMYLQASIQVVMNENFDLKIMVEEDLKNENTTATATSTDIHYNEKVEASNLNPDYTFDTFVIGENNKHAHAVCTAVAAAPGKDYNPLFLYGGPGLGKTHLMQSVAHYILQNNPSMKVLYVSSETFTNEIIEAIKKNKTEEIRNKYRNNDVLLIDDIQFIIGKESTQQEFFNTFNFLYESKKQIIITSDRPPKELKSLDERYISRFEWGGPVDIHAPEYETRMAILTSKAERDNITNIPYEVFQYIANNIVSNIRELEGALKKLSVYSKFGNQEITVKLAEEVLKDLVSNDAVKDVTPDLIIRTVAEHLNVSYEDIISNKRSQDIATARQISMYLCRKMTDKTLNSIGDAVGGKDHSTVLNGINKIEEGIKTNQSLANTVDIIKKKISPN